MESYQIKTFVTVARQGTIARASESLLLSQPAASAHIKALETELGVALFERTSRGMCLTTGGSALLDRAENLLALHRQFMAEARALRAPAPTKLRIGAMQCTSSVLLGRFMARLTKVLPGLEIALEHGTSDQVVRQINEGNFDVGFFSESDVCCEELDIVELDQCEIYLASSPSASNAAPTPDLTVLSGMPWIYATSDPCCSRAADTFFEAHGFQPSRTLNVDDEQVTRSLIGAGAGVGLLHAGVAQEARAHGDVALLGLLQHGRSLQAGMITRRQPRLLTEAVRFALEGLVPVRPLGVRLANFCGS